MREIWKVTIYSMNGGKRDTYETECETKEEVARVIMTYKAKRRYEILKYRIEREWWLV